MSYLSVDIGDYVLWRGELAFVFSKTSGQTFVGLQMVELPRCEKCGHPQPKHQFDVIESSPLFQENTKPVPTPKQKASK